MNFFNKWSVPRLHPLNLSFGLMDDNGLFPEAMFNQMLSWERKRTERTHRPFLLMLLEIQNSGLNGSAAALHEKIGRALLGCTRDTDQRGWYVQDHVAGVIFTELNDEDVCQSRDTVKARVTEVLGQTLSANEQSRIDIAIHVFPEGCEAGDPCCPGNKVLYPDHHVERRVRSLDHAAKRALDIAGSLAALLILSPVVAVIAIAIKLTSKGPVLYRQERVGQYGRRINFLKFRSMKVDNDPSIHREYVQKLIAGALDQKKDGNTVFKIKNDPRVTAVGRFIRRTSLDEIPQFWNVLAGDMSLVGPRPPIPYELEKYDTWHRQRILSMKPGITGLWQVTARSRATFDEMVRLDIRYIRSWSLWLDLRLILSTPWVALTGKGGF